MRIVSAFDDFMHRTLDTMEGVWQRLEFLAGLRVGKKQYEHWGMSATYGEEKANKAISEAHTSVFLDTLRTPVPDLYEQATRADAAKEGGVGEYAEHLSRNENVVPSELAGGSAQHFSLVLKMLKFLARSRGSSNHRAS